MKLFSYSIQLSTKFILLINVKVPTRIVGILTFISRINSFFKRFKAKICVYFVNILVFFKTFGILCSVELSMKKVL